MKVKIIPAFETKENNYMYLIIDEKSKEAAVVDPVNPDEVLRVVKEEEVTLTAALITHHHWDHAGGNKELLSKAPDVTIYGGDHRVYGVSDKSITRHGEMITLGSITVKFLHTPCHTTSHFCYYVKDENEADACVFTGDTLFLGGCGRFFEGTGKEMYYSLIDVLGKLPIDTKVYCGHEYSVGSLTYAAHAQPGNKAVIEKLSWSKEVWSKGLPTVPSTIKEEFAYNPFMRVNEPEMQKRCGTASGIATMDYLRSEKNNFKPRKV